ncbi:MAG: SBBP repeat-containing protein, partial [Bdellovibrionales bacterium]|nr:SBBP repeat-containing protein [Bdellovibrionales bacterium]
MRLFPGIFSLTVWLGLGAFSSVSSAAAAPAFSATAASSLPAAGFVQNDGRFPEAVRFWTQTFAGTLFVTDSEIVHTLAEIPASDRPRLSGTAAQAIALRERFIDAFPLATVRGERRNDAAQLSFIKGGSSASSPSAYHAVTFGEVWPGVTVQLQARAKNAEKLFVVDPGGSVSDIEVAIDGADALAVGAEGELILYTQLGPVRMTAPKAYQLLDGAEVPVTVRYRTAGLRYGFTVGRYDPHEPLIIDPLLASTFVGGGSVDRLKVLLQASSGELVVVGASNSTAYPTTAGVYSDTLAGDFDIVVSKFSSDLKTLYSSTYLGGGDLDEPVAAVFDSVGSLYVVAETGSNDFPTTAGAAQDTYGGGYRDIVVAKLDSSLTTLEAATYIGGDTYDVPSGIERSSAGEIYVAGYTTSTDFPLAGSPYDSTQENGDSAIVRLSADLSTITAGTLLGATGLDISYDLALEAGGTVILTGATTGADFPTTAGAYDTTHNGNNDVYLARLSGDLSALLASTLLGGTNLDVSADVLPLPSGAIAVLGTTQSSNFPATLGAADITYAGSNDLFVALFSNDLGTLSTATFLGGASAETAGRLIRAANGDLYVVGSSRSSDYPATSTAYDPTHNGDNDGVITRLSNNLSAIVASTFLGSSASDTATALVLDSSGNVVVGGSTTSPSFPTTTGAYSEIIQGSRDIFLSMLTPDLSLDGAYVTITDPGVQVNAANVSAYVVSGNCSDPGQSVSVQAVDGGSGMVGGSTSCVSGNAWSLTLGLSSLAEGGVTITANHAPASGPSASPAVLNRVKDTIVPAAPVIT